MFSYVERQFPVGSIVTLKKDSTKREYKVFEVFKNSGRLIIRNINWGDGEGEEFIQLKVDASEIEHSTELGRTLYE